MSLPKLDAQGAIQKAVYALLSANFSNIEVTDSPKEGEKMPYFRIGTSWAVPNDTKDIPGDIITHQIDYFYSTPGNKDGWEVISKVKSIFTTRKPPQIEAPFLINVITPEYSEIIEEQDTEGPNKHAVIRLSFSVQQI